MSEFIITLQAFSLITLFSFQDLDKAEADLNEIGRGDRAGFVDEHPAENRA